MRSIFASEIKHRVKELGGDLCKIAPIERFKDAPVGFHPTDIIKECKSVIVIALRFPVSTLAASSQAVYTLVRNKLTEKMDSITYQLSLELEDLGSLAVPIPSTDPYEYWDDAKRHGQGILSLKHAAVLAGLGQMGKNTLLINDQLGNMVWLGAVLIDKELEADRVAAYTACPPSCQVCLDSCPVKALDGITINQSKCRSIAAKSSPGGGYIYACNLCRKLCPQAKGITKPREELYGNFLTD